MTSSLVLDRAAIINHNLPVLRYELDMNIIINILKKKQNPLFNKIIEMEKCAESYIDFAEAVCLWLRDCPKATYLAFIHTLLNDQPYASKLLTTIKASQHKINWFLSYDTSLKSNEPVPPNAAALLTKNIPTILSYTTLDTLCKNLLTNRAITLRQYARLMQRPLPSTLANTILSGNNATYNAFIYTLPTHLKQAFL